jgi:hypothetical protein
MSVGARRLLALVVAIALIGLALLLRGVLFGDDDDGGGSADDGGRPRLLCIAELETVCNELADEHDIDVEIEQAGVSVDRIADLPDDQLRDLGFDGWLTLSRDAEIAAQKRERNTFAPATGDPSDPIGRSPLVIGIWRDRAAALGEACGGGDLTWRCVGDFAGREWVDAGGDPAWGQVKPAHADPATTGEGLLVIGQAASNFYGRTDLSIDDYADDAFLEWFSRLEDNARIEAESPFEQMLVGGAALYDMVGTLEAQAGPELSRASRDRRDQVRLLYPAPVATADVVYVPAVDADGADDLDDLLTGDDGRTALARAGWRVDGEPSADGVPDAPPLPARDNLPDAGSLQALLDTWREVTG